MQLTHTRVIVTADNIERVREAMSGLDQAKELAVGCETWGILYEPGNQRGQITVWPDNDRAAVMFGGDSEYGDWDAEARTITLDCGCVVDEDGETETCDEHSGEAQ